MKQTTLLPFYTPTNPKKSPLPFIAKTSLKAAPIRSPCLTSIQPFDDLSPIVKSHKTEHGGNEETEFTPVKPMSKATLRRSREVFSGITQSITKKIKNEAEGAESQQQTIQICLNTPTKDISTPKKVPAKPAFKMAYLCSQDTADKSVLSSSHDLDASDLSFTEQDNRSSLLSLSPKPRDETKRFTASGLKRFFACARKLDMDKAALFGEEASIDEKCVLLDEKELACPVQEHSTVEIAQISQKTLDLVKNLRAQYGLTRSVSAIEISEIHGKKMVEEKDGDEEPRISNKTMGLIKMIKAKSVPAMVTEEPELEANDNETPTLRERFEELLGDKREFVMPVSYKRLLKAFEELDKTVSMFSEHKEELCFGKLKQCVESSVKREFTITQLAQIMHVMPEAYTISWENNDLYIGFTNQTNTEERQAIFKNTLLNIVKKHHSDFLSTLPEQERVKDYEKIKCWNARFDVHACPVIPQFELPTEAKLLYKTEAASVFRQYRKLTGISDKVLARVRITEQELTHSIKNREFSREFDQEDVKKVAESIADYYTKREVCSMFLVNVVEYLAENLNNVAQYIGFLLDICPEWLSLEEVKEVQVLKINKGLDMATVFAKIQKKNN